jgi:hypothetical protein
MKTTRQIYSRGKASERRKVFAFNCVCGFTVEFHAANNDIPCPSCETVWTYKGSYVQEKEDKTLKNRL